MKIKHSLFFVFSVLIGLEEPQSCGGSETRNVFVIKIQKFSISWSFFSTLRFLWCSVCLFYCLECCINAKEIDHERGSY